MSRRVRISLLTIGGCLLIGGTFLFFYQDKIQEWLNSYDESMIWYRVPYQKENGRAISASVTRDPNRPTIDLAPKIRKRCTQTLQWTIFDNDVLMRINYPRLMENIARKMKPYIHSAYLQIEHRTGCKPPDLEAYIYPLPMSFSFRRVNYTAEMPCSEGFVSIPFLFDRTEKSATDSELFEGKFYSLVHEIGHIILYQKVCFSDIGLYTARWFDEGFSQHLTGKVIRDIGLSSSSLSPSSKAFFNKIIECLEDPFVQGEFYKWRPSFISHDDPNAMLSLMGNATDIKEYWTREKNLYKASHAVMLAIETIGGEDTIKNILKTITVREEKTVTPDELFEIVNQHLGFDIRDWDRFINAYKQKTSVEIFPPSIP